ncbi:hypothetical protein BCON_0122g00090 [Botryotinia convoluta]|uniref:Uncharacterized protein n=1 Tax=Botryotinia convoluta TaxID=54673 RepID=A0A4Z1I244_9HELO|nr:hypothetical protein BCON_0122g00090 [Botryotinia convoluta]
MTRQSDPVSHLPSAIVPARVIGNFSRSFGYVEAPAAYEYSPLVELAMALYAQIRLKTCSLDTNQRKQLLLTVQGKF